MLAFCLAPVREAGANAWLFDFGGPESPSGGASTGVTQFWNNVTAAEGGSEGAEVFFMVDVDGVETQITLLMQSRFNGANESGAASSGPYPATATRDSLYGNTEVFGGLENVTPAFILYGFTPGATLSLTFYASRLGVSDNRETRYTARGGATVFADLDASNNVTNTVRLAGITADPAGEIVIELAPGPNNDNANHFTYLGVLQIETADGRRLLLDFGAGGSPTLEQEPEAPLGWNNVLTAVGADNAGSLPGLVSTNGTATTAGFQMVSRFNGANLNGTTASTAFPASATRDSLFGNTAAFSGLSDVLPVFKLTGLDPNYRYGFAFFASRTGVTDNRETRYTVRGASEAVVDLDAANNVDGFVATPALRPDAAGEISVALTAGPNNNNGNRFTYLGVMRVDFTPVVPPGILIDFGAVGSPTLQGAGGVELVWNNVPNTLASASDGVVTNLVRTDGTVTEAAFRMVSRFNGANENGTTAEAPFPVSATRDSLFGNTELFSELENVTPVFRLTGLNPATAYTLDFYASRMGVGDNRETIYRVTGAVESSIDLNVANNETEIATLTDLRPDAAGEFSVALEPGPNNDNGNHFVYLGVLRMSWSAPDPATPATLDQAVVTSGTFSFRLRGTAGATYRVLGSDDFRLWTDVRSVPLGDTGSATVEIPATGGWRYFQAVSP